MGMTGLETALSVVQKTLVDTGMIDWSTVARITSRRPSEILRLRDQGGALEAGAPANITLWNPAGETPVNPETHVSKGRNSPYKGMSLPGSVSATFYRGHPVVLDGELNSPLSS